jgi:hypothetical protein
VHLRVFNHIDHVCTLHSSLKRIPRHKSPSSPFLAVFVRARWKRPVWNQWTQLKNLWK